jgi:hypothetical protein
MSGLITSAMRNRRLRAFVDGRPGSLLEIVGARAAFDEARPL